MTITGVKVVLRLNKEEKYILVAMGSGQSLKSHRYLDGTKVFLLHEDREDSLEIRGETVATLVQKNLIDSNKKFPVTTFWLTPIGKAQLKKYK